MAELETNDSVRQLSAPYTAFASVKTALAQFKEHGMPQRVDRSVLPTFSGAVGSQVMTGLRFLGLIDQSNNSQRTLQELVDALGTDEWPATLRAVLQSAYAPLFNLSLETASPSQFNELFRREYPAADEVSRKATTFFLNAAREADIKISPYILRNKKPRSNGAKKRSVRSGDAPTAAPATPSWERTAPRKSTHRDPPPSSPPPADKRPSEMLLDHFKPHDMDDATQNAVWTLIKYFKGLDL
ncbi:DUF5343 domain-containing protein [Reyranella sp.]|uniref:DUF5343 domain-containing protein n=1 Tax=Reyranella sp. TaxID=1929291 RepID=UPI002717F09D|nr:DUF5343 domain-containing protein [Reyranella sp.]MDO8972878.1 DUF5343 domain-containing protein [Reyranella sp.]